MNKIIITLLAILVVIGAVITAIIIYMPESKNQNETIVEDISDEYNNIDENIEENITNMVETNSTEEKISPNAFITFERIYKECGHTTSEFLEVPQEFVNLTESELKEKYTDWNIEKFTDEDIVLSKEEEGSCNEHYIIKDVDGTVVVYHVLDNGEEEEYMVTDIATEYLTDTDKIEMENGVEVNGKQNLNQLIEDYE